MQGVTNFSIRINTVILQVIIIRIEVQVIIGLTNQAIIQIFLRSTAGRAHDKTPRTRGNRSELEVTVGKRRGFYKPMILIGFWLIT
jgi:hypothetical protein